MNLTECDGEVGAVPVEVEVWPSPQPIPNTVVPTVNRTQANATNATVPQPPEPLCEDDLEFRDLKGLSCSDYTMNAELCAVADQLENKRGQTARHACCRCGGSAGVVPSIVTKCSRPRMGGDEGCTEENELKSRGSVDRMISKSNGSRIVSDFDDSPLARMMGTLQPGKNEPDVDIEDQLDDDAVDSIGTIDAMNTILEPDSIVFREHNFAGIPREPVSGHNVPQTDAVVGTIRFSLPFSVDWKTTHGSMLTSALAAAAGVPAHEVALGTVTPGSGVNVEYRVMPQTETTLTVMSRMSDTFKSGMLPSFLSAHHFPRCNMTVGFGPRIQTVDIPSDSMAGSSSVHKQYNSITYSVGPHETIESIAAKFHISASLLVAFNEDVADPLMIKEGDILFIPIPRVLHVDDVSPLESPLGGGVQIQIKGSGFVYPAFCKFGDLITRATHVVPDLITCSTPEQQNPGLMSLSVSDGKGGFLKTSFLFHYTAALIPFCGDEGATPNWCRPRLAIYSATPNRIPQDIAATVVVLGTGFNTSTVCKLGETPVETTVVSRSKILCHIPPMLPKFDYLHLAQGSESVFDSPGFMIYSTLAVNSVEPPSGPEIGGNPVTVRGSTFKPGCFCRFEDMLVPAKFISSSEIQCVAPGKSASVVNIDVTNDKQVYTPTSVQYTYTKMRVDTVTPEEGMVKGGNVVVLTGDGFHMGSWCRFGTEKRLSEYVNINTIKCLVPPQTEGKSVRVSVSADGVRDWTEEEVMYHYYGDVTAIEPTAGSAQGGDIVNVHGEGFDRHCAYTCRFGITVVPAIVVSPTHLKCVSPAGLGQVPLVVESKDRRYKRTVMGEELSFTYVGASDIDIFGISPSHTYVRNANTTAELRGSGFTTGTLCRFGDKISMAEFIDSSLIRCNVPMRDLAEVVPVTASHDGGLTWTGTLAYFEYRGVIDYLEPAMGHVSGGNVVVVHGHGFNYRISVCVFGNKVVQANITNQYELACVVPSSHVAKKVQFSVTCNESVLYDPLLDFEFVHPQIKTWGDWYLYSSLPTFKLAKISPSSGSVRGGTEIIVEGEGFDRTSHCKFDSDTVKAEFLDAATVRCVSPPHRFGPVKIEVMNFNKTEGYTMTSSSATFTYKAPTVTHLEPAEGYVHGGDLIKLHGSYLDGASSCLFGKIRVPVEKVTDKYIVCTSPKVDTASRVPVSVSYGIAGSGLGDMSFLYHAVITDVTPLNAFIMSDRHSIIITGDGFSGEETWCKFGDNKVKANIRSETTLECAVPEVTYPQIKQLYLTNANQEVVGNRTFEIKYHPIIQDMHPPEGATTGGTTVVLVGAGLSHATHCNFDTTLVPAVVVSDVMLRCTSPSHAPGRVRVSASSDTFLSNPFDFEYKVLSTHVTLTHPSSGAATGGTFVTLRGSGFSISSYCKFGDVEVPVVYYAPDHIGCYSPEGAANKTVSLEVSQVGGYEAYSNDGFSFTYNANISSVSRLEPSWAEAGDVIRVVGAGFDQSSECYFGPRKSESTVFVSESVLQCKVPTIGSKMQEVVQVASNPTHLPGGHVMFHYDNGLSDGDSPAVREVIPDSGPSAGGTAVDVYGVNFPSKSMCRFGDLFISATVISSKHVQCISPAHRAATTVVEVLSSDKSVFSSSGIRFKYEAANETPVDDLLDSVAAGEPAIEEVEPSSARVGDTLKITGKQFPSAGICVFSDEKASVQVTAITTDSTAIACDVPRRVHGMGRDVLLKYTSMSGTSSHSVPFHYLE